MYCLQKVPILRNINVIPTYVCTHGTRSHAVQPFGNTIPRSRCWDRGGIGSFPTSPTVATMKGAETESPALPTASLRFHVWDGGKLLRNLFSVEIICSQAFSQGEKKAINICHECVYKLSLACQQVSLLSRANREN